ncbi:SAM-dependent methyltransferase [Streptomyces yaizuensis]|uniref:SAM-dependent methyltransferase n=1 Tax=Streptomyces yaizuensis TaxID=2989713 RepID=A0ABQ5NRX7_9ACTN|nr:SAM-dependent methyltransferase [Streptomyces sp. YSPA8]GLF92796.1 SAM-dependent methyltransferase [Streptomyces sp. YSPA8]
MERPAWASPGTDISVPSVSRMHDYYLGGSHNFEADRAAARRAMEHLPGLPKVAQAGRAFMRRAVRYAVGAGITQFIDVGSGIPACGGVHEAVFKLSPTARVVHADHDPVAVAHGRRLLDGEPRAAVIAADLRRPRQILEAPEVRELLDLRLPTALLLIGVLDFIEDVDDPYSAVATLRDALAPGSLLVIGHTAYDGMPVPEDRAARLTEVYRDIRHPLIMRTQDRIARFFEGYEMVEPGLVSPPHWRPDAPAEPEDPYAFTGYAGVGRSA